MPKPPPGCMSNPSGDPETQHPFTSAVQAGSVSYCLVESTGGNRSRLPKLSFGRSAFQGRSIQGLSWKHSCSCHSTGHAWEGAASQTPLQLLQSLLPLEAH